MLLSEIRIDGGTQPRASIDQSVVAEYAEAMRAGTELPPVVVFFDGAAHWLADGFHRYHAARAAGLEAVETQIRNGTQRDAVLFSVGANADHGLRRTNEDKRRAVLTLLKDAEWSAKSDRWIAEKCGVSHTFVAERRAELATVASCSAPRQGKDGKTRKAPSKPPKGQLSDEQRKEIQAQIAEEQGEPPEPSETEAPMPRRIPTRPRDGMQFARIAVLNLKQIQANDLEREEAFRHVKEWIGANESKTQEDEVLRLV